MATKTKPRVIEIPDTAKVNADEIPVHTNGNGNGHVYIEKIVRTFPPKKKRPNPVQRVLDKALEAFKTHRWIQGALGHDDMFCAIGAVNFALTGDPGDRGDNEQLRNRVIKRLYLQLPKHVQSGYPEESVMSYNDNLAVTTGRRSVMRIFRKALDSF